MYYCCVFRSNWCSILVFTNNCHCCSFTFELWVWSEVYCSIWIYCVSSFSWNRLSCSTIFECCWYFIIHWYFYFFSIDCSFTRFEFWFTALRCTLNIFSECINTYWSYWFNSWCVSSCCWSSIRIFRLNCCWYWSTYKVFVRCECHFSCCWIDCVCTNFFSISVFRWNCCCISWLSSSWID